jgi:hypothetical protein
LEEAHAVQTGNLVTIHYHRYDADYDNVSIWTWDAYFKRSPEQNEIFEVGRDAYGSILQLDRGDYGLKGDSDKIGLLPRLEVIGTARTERRQILEGRHG